MVVWPNSKHFRNFFLILATTNHSPVCPVFPFWSTLPPPHPAGNSACLYLLVTAYCLLPTACWSLHSNGRSRSDVSPSLYRLQSCWPLFNPGNDDNSKQSQIHWYFFQYLCFVKVPVDHATREAAPLMTAPPSGNSTTRQSTPIGNPPITVICEQVKVSKNFLI